MRKRWLAAATVAALALLLVDVGTSSAQLFRRGGRGYYGSGVGWGGNYYGGWGSGYIPMYGGSGYYPNYVSGYLPSYGYTQPLYQTGYPLAGNITTLPGDTTSFYYQPGMTAGIGVGNGRVDNRSALVEVRVPPDAQVWFDGDATRQRGSDRLYTSPPLDQGQTYSYQVKARWSQNGKPVERTKTVRVRAGQRAMVDFGQQAQQTETE